MLFGLGSCPKEHLQNCTEARSFPLQGPGPAVSLPMGHKPALQTNVPSGPTLLRLLPLLPHLGPLLPVDDEVLMQVLEASEHLQHNALDLLKKQEASVKCATR